MVMTSARNIAIAAGIAVVVIAAGVGAFLFLGGSEETGRVIILVKDAPDDWKHVNVTFSEVKIHKANASNSSGWQTLKIANGTVDLTDFVNVSALLADGNVSVGKYTQIRIVVINVTGEMTDGTKVNFTVPSGELKANHPFYVEAGKAISLTIDIDLSRSIVHNNNGWKFTPVLGPVTQA